MAPPEPTQDKVLAQKRRIIHQINRYKEKFSLRLRRTPSEKMSVQELEEIKTSLRTQMTEKEAPRIIKSLYVQGLSTVDNISQAAGYTELRGLGQVANAVANDEENELLWEELAIEFEDYLTVSPQRKLIMLTAQVLLTTYKINTDVQYAAFMAEQINKQKQGLQDEYNDL